MEIQYIIKQLAASGMTQATIAQAIGVCQATISNLYTGKKGKKRPSDKVVSGLRKLARKRGIQIVAPKIQEDRER